jgi:molybdopterin converting factor small subunit
MKIHVRLFANLRDRFPRGERGRGSVELPTGASLQDLLDHLEIPPRSAQMVLVDGQQVARHRDARAAIGLEAGQTVSIFPPLAGG